MHQGLGLRHRLPFVTAYLHQFIDGCFRSERLDNYPSSDAARMIGAQENRANLATAGSPMRSLVPSFPLKHGGVVTQSYVPPQIRRSTKLSLADNHIMRSPFFPSPVSSSVLLFYTARVASLTLNSPQLLTPKLPAPLTSSNSSANASLADGPFASSSILSHLIIECDANLYGQGLNYDSCHDAYDQIPHFVSEMTWGPRTQGRWSVNLPWRAYSCEFDTRANLHTSRFQSQA